MRQPLCQEGCGARHRWAGGGHAPPCPDLRPRRMSSPPLGRGGAGGCSGCAGPSPATRPPSSCGPWGCPPCCPHPLPLPPPHAGPRAAPTPVRRAGGRCRQGRGHAWRSRCWWHRPGGGAGRAWRWPPAQSVDPSVTRPGRHLDGQEAPPAPCRRQRPAAQLPAAGALGCLLLPPAACPAVQWAATAVRAVPAGAERRCRGRGLQPCAQERGRPVFGAGPGECGGGARSACAAQLLAPALRWLLRWPVQLPGWVGGRWVGGRGWDCHPPMEWGGRPPGSWCGGLDCGRSAGALVGVAGSCGRPPPCIVSGRYSGGSSSSSGGAAGLPVPLAAAAAPVAVALALAAAASPWRRLLQQGAAILSMVLLVFFSVPRWCSPHAARSGGRRH